VTEEASGKDVAPSRRSPFSALPRFEQELERRTIGLPAQVIGDKAKARLDDGVLEVVVPKAEKSRRQTVEIES
jgi:HSP20 family molecular chaperone IbpA